ncbi:immunoglobulin domain-containing protein [Vibrio parahaemolyticus]|nr:immunoglobulin domain-containing protein [Vibrio parahaemolyticus]ELC0687691.1 immunoglobulin domain-containing protein [Vibrio parahaemolyticus]
MRLTIKTHGLSGYTGKLGYIDFNNGFSEELSKRDLDRLSCIIAVERSDKEPEFTKDLSSTKTATEGQPLELEVAVSGGGCTYDWVKDGINIAKGSPKLTIEKFKPEDAGDYLVVVNNPYGFIVSTVCSVSL